MGVAIVAHQGGWDEILLVAGPLAVIVALLVLVKRRVGRRSQPDESPAQDR